MINSKEAIILLHEIYGVNPFIEGMCQQYKSAGYDVLCPNIINREYFSYQNTQEAYAHFMNSEGFDYYKEVNKMVRELKDKYKKVFIIGFSVGATIAWRCSNNTLCDGVVAYYGSRIRDFVNIIPVCPTLLLFSKEDSFDIELLVKQVMDKENVEVHTFATKHGFMNTMSNNYNVLFAKQAQDITNDFLKKNGYKRYR